MANINLSKIGWQNGTLVSKAKVEIGGTIYEVEPEEYSGATPLSAENLSQMEDNTETGLNQILHMLEGTVLYNDSNGTTGNVTLSQDISNMKRIRISGFQPYGSPIVLFHFSQDFDVVIDEKTGIILKSNDGNVNSYIATEIITIGATSITRGSQYNHNLTTPGRTETSLYITKVIGYDY